MGSLHFERITPPTSLSYDGPSTWYGGICTLSKSKLATGEDVEMEDDYPLGAVGGEGATGGTSPVNKEDEALLDEVETPQTQVISNMRNLSVHSPSNPALSQSETKL